MCNKYVNHFRNNPKLSIGEFMNIVRSSLTFEVYHSSLTKKKPPKQIQGTYIEQYAKLSNYCTEIKRTNPGSTLIVKTELVYDKLVFEMIYIYMLRCM